MIDAGLAHAMAGMIAVGLASGDNEVERARTALTGCALMLRNSFPHDPTIVEILTLADAAVVEVNEGTINVYMQPAG
jgi:hypothetical protein